MQHSDEADGVLEIDQRVYASRLYAFAHQEVAGSDQLCLICCKCLSC